MLQALTLAEYEAQVARLIGLRLPAVRYYELPGEPGWNAHLNFDSLDYGLDLQGEDGRCFGLIWGQTFAQYDVAVLSHALLQELSSATFTDVSLESRWADVTGQVITTVMVSWQSGFEPDGAPYPEAVTLQLTSGQRIHVAALEFRDETGWIGMADHLSVFFDDRAAAAAGRPMASATFAS